MYIVYNNKIYSILNRIFYTSIETITQTFKLMYHKKPLASFDPLKKKI